MMFFKKFGEKLKNLFGGRKINEEFFEELEDTLIEGDLGARLTDEIVQSLRDIAKKEGLTEASELQSRMKDILSQYIRSYDRMPEKGELTVYMILGVNGVGKTTTIAKMAKYYTAKGLKVLLAAGDTFRAAAIEQLCLHGDKLGIRTISHQHGSDPGAVIFDALESVNSKGGGLVIADTAGRLHTKENLVNELKKIIKIAETKASPGCCKKIIVLDSTTGLNGLRQAEVFNEAVGLDGIILTKYDSTAKGGAAFSAGKDLGLPVIFTCFGEKYGDIKKFDVAEYVEGFLS